MRCDECGYDYDTLTREHIAPAIRSDAEAFVRAFTDVPAEGARVRPAPDVWSPLEYACHVRDVLEVQRGRVALAQTAKVPAFEAMRRDERAVELHYNEQDPATVSGQIRVAADLFAGTLDALPPTGWERTGIYNYPEPRERTVEWIGRHTVHELRHHAHDIGLGAGRPPG